MARISHVQSPEKHDLEEDEVNEGDAELEHSDTDAANDGRVLHLGSDLPDIVSELGETQTPRKQKESHAPVVNMGNTNSREEVMQTSREVGDEIRRKIALETAEFIQKKNARNKRPSTGKLKRVSSSAKNPLSSPATGVNSAMRKLGPSSVRPTSTYDFEEGSPEKHPALQLKRWEDEPRQFSPRRTDRKKAQKASKQPDVPSSDPVSEAQYNYSSPRRSRRQQDLPAPETQIEARTPKAHQRRVEWAREHTESSEENAQFRDVFADRVVQRYQEEDADADAGAGEEEEQAENIQVADHSDEAVVPSPVAHGEAQPTQPVQKPRGRPRKSDKSPEDTTPGKKKPGRPKKIESVFQEPVVHVDKTTTPQKNARHVDERHADDPVVAEHLVTPGDQDEQARKGLSPSKSQQISAGAVSASKAADSTVRVAETNMPREVKRHTGSNGVAAVVENATKAKGPRARAQKSVSRSPQKAKPPQSSMDKLEDLRRRRSGEVDNEYDPGVEEASEAEQATAAATAESPSKGLFVEGGNEEDLPERPVAPIRPTRVRPSEMFAEAHGEEDNEPEQYVQQSPAKIRKRKASTQPAQPNTTAKRTRFGEHEEQADEQGPSESSRPGQHRLYGQWRAFQQVFRNLELVGCNTDRNGIPQAQNPIDLRDDDVKATLKLCKEAMLRFTTLKNDPENLATHDPAAVLDEIGKRVDGFRGVSEEFQTDFKNKSKSTDIYFFLIPKLVRLVKHAFLCYEAMDTAGQQVADGQITNGHLRIVTELMKLILDLEKAAQKYARPGSDLSVIRPVHNGIAVPLRDIHATLNMRTYQQHLALLETQRKEEGAKDRALRLEQDERRYRQQANIDRLREKWEKLHQERMWAEEGLLMSRQKREHLRLPDHYVEMDQNGMPFERTEVFLPRVGPAPGLVDEAVAREWSLVELSTLCDGLKQYAGPHVFERIFRKYCHKRGELNKYNVTEIVTIAAGLRETLSANQMNQYGDVEDWITAIPVWTKGHQAVGKENEDGGAGAGAVDLAMES